MLTIIITGTYDRQYAAAGYQTPVASLPIPGGGALLERVICTLPSPRPGDRIYVIAPERDQGMLASSLFVAQGKARRIEMVLEGEQTSELKSALCARRWLRGRDELLFLHCYGLPDAADLAAFLLKVRSTTYPAGLAVQHVPHSLDAYPYAFWFREARHFLRLAEREGRGKTTVVELIWAITRYDVPNYYTWRAQGFAPLMTPQAYSDFVNQASAVDNLRLVRAEVA